MLRDEGVGSCCGESLLQLQLLVQWGQGSAPNARRGLNYVISPPHPPFPESGVRLDPQRWYKSLYSPRTKINIQQSRRMYQKTDLLTVFAALCFTDFIDWRYILSWLVFSTQLVNCCSHGRRNYTCVLLPIYLLSDPPLPKLNVQYIQTVCAVGGGGGGGLNCAVDHILQEFYTMSLTRFRTYKIASPPQTKWPVKTTFRDWCL